VSQLDGAKQIALGTNHTCVLQPDATVWCMGDNTWGELGVPNPSLRDRLHKVVGLP
jgi:alpha-tubulin suppressor-like RCC1 family protein